MNQPDELLSRLRAIRNNVESVIFGKSDVVRLAVTALIARGHLLIEDIPGLGKTSLARALARSIDCAFRRIQFTPDLLPGDVTGLSIYDADRKEFVFKPGPVFTNILLADEINRATPRAQSALLEAMNEGRVTVDGTTRALPDPFLVLATQNPLEFTGTYPLPESQLDRFFMVLRIGYPAPEEERRILASRHAGDPVEQLKPVATTQDVLALCERAATIRMNDAVTAYVVDLAGRTRADKDLVAGISPRAALHLTRAAQAHAMIEGRDFVTPHDVKTMALPVLAHRVIERRTRASSNGHAGAQQTLRRILQETPVPQ